MQKTITMPTAIADAWLADLRSGKAKQCDGELRDGNGGFCCLGRLEVVVSRKCEYADLPSLGWLNKHEILFMDKNGNENDSPWLPTVREYASDMNDRGAKFAEIADALEPCIKRT